MATPTVGDRALEEFTTTGTGTITLGGAVNGYRTLTAACGDGETVHYCITMPSDGSVYEVGEGTISSGTLSRDTIYASSNGDTLVSLASGTKRVAVVFTQNAFDQFMKTDAAQTMTAQLTLDETKITELEMPALDVDPANGSRQWKTLTGNSTFTESLENGQAVSLYIDDGSAYTITHPTITWLTDSGSAPTLKTSGFTGFVYFKMNSTLYGIRTTDGG